MRTTVTIDPDLAAKLRRLARERGISFKDAFNAVLRAGLAGQASARPYRLEPRPLGLRPGIDLERALRLAGALEDEETVRKLRASRVPRV